MVKWKRVKRGEYASELGTIVNEDGWYYGPAASFGDVMEGPFRTFAAAKEAAATAHHQGLLNVAAPANYPLPWCEALDLPYWQVNMRLCLNRKSWREWQAHKPMSVVIPEIDKLLSRGEDRT